MSLALIAGLVLAAWVIAMVIAWAIVCLAPARGDRIAEAAFERERRDALTRASQPERWGGGWRRP